MRPIQLLIAIAGLGFVGSAVAVTRMTTITESGHAFSETDLALKVGDHVQFVNQDDTGHHVLVQDAANEVNTKDMGLQEPNAAPLDLAFDRAGKFKVHCHIHSAMVLNVTVQ